MNRHEDTHSLIFGLAYACPYREEDHACPLSILRALPFGNRVSVLNELPPEVITQYYQQHKACAARKEARACVPLHEEQYF